MGKALAAQYPVARRVFQEADEALGFSLSKLCFEESNGALAMTENTQPALLTVSTAAYRVLEALGITPAYVAGHSLGEYSALVAAGAIAFADAVKLVRQRGKCMQEAVPVGVGTMAAWLKPPMDKLPTILNDAAQGEVVETANFNSPDQIVIAGHVGAVNRANEMAKAAGAKRAVTLQVSAPFHCSLMKPAQEAMSPYLDGTPFHDLKYPLINNWQAKEIHTPAEAREGLFQQIPNSVRWTDSIRALLNAKIDRFIEVGEGKVLCGLLKQIEPTATSAKFGDPADLEKLRELLA